MKIRNVLSAVVASGLLVSPIAAQAGTQAAVAMPAFSSVSEGARASVSVAPQNRGVRRSHVVLGALAAGAAGLGIYFAVRGDRKTQGS